MEARRAFIWRAALFGNLGAFGVVSLMSAVSAADADSLYSYRVCSGTVGSCRGDDGDDAVAGRYPNDAGLLSAKFYVLAVGVQATCGGWSPPWWWVRDWLYYYLRVAVSLYLHAPQQPGRDAPTNWQYSTAGGIVVLISALLVLVLGVWPQPLIGLIAAGVPLM